MHWVPILLLLEEFSPRSEMEKYPGLLGFYQCKKKYLDFTQNTWITLFQLFSNPFIFRIQIFFESRYLESSNFYPFPGNPPG